MKRIYRNNFISLFECMVFTCLCHLSLYKTNNNALRSGMEEKNKKKISNIKGSLSRLIFLHMISFVFLHFLIISACVSVHLYVWQDMNVFYVIMYFLTRCTHNVIRIRMVLATPNKHTNSNA